MSEDMPTPDIANHPVNIPPKTTKSKRDIFRFNGVIPTAINLEHVTHISVEGKKITFNFYTTSLFIEMENDEAALSIFEVLLNTWAADVVE